MTAYSFWLLALLSATSLLPAQTTGTAEKEIEKKIKALEDQIDDLRKQQQTLLQEKKTQPQSATMKRLAKVEVHGTLVMIKDRLFLTNHGLWLKVEVDFQGSKELLTLARKHTGKNVVLTGWLRGTLSVAQLPTLQATPLDPPILPLHDLGIIPPGPDREWAIKQWNEQLNRARQAKALMESYLAAGDQPAQVRVIVESLKLADD
jgi:hypothetical protein